MFSSETYSIEDCYYYNSTGISYTSNSTSDRQVSTGLESFEFNPPSKWELSFDLEASTYGKRFYLVSKAQSTTSNKYGLGGDIDTNACASVLRTTASDSVSGTKVSGTNSFKFSIDGTSLTQYVNGSSLRTKTVSWWDTYKPYVFKWGIWNTGTVTVTNIKVKPL